jgi:hypothetical protein
MADRQGYLSSVYTANTAGSAIGTTSLPVSGASGATLKLIQGYLHTISVGSDTTACVITIYDNSSGAASGTMLFTNAVPASWSECFILDLQANNGLTVVISGGTTPRIVVTYN